MMKKTLSSNEDEEYAYVIETSPNPTLLNNINVNSLQDDMMVNIQPKQNDRSNNNGSIGYTEKLENKVREQARRLTEVEKYRYLCERRIKQLSPGHALPVTESHLNETSGAGDKYEILQKKYSQLLADYTDLTQQKLRSSFSKISLDNKTLFHPEKIQTMEKMKESYATLLQMFEQVLEEKEQILEILRNETVNVEEQRNYIEILKQTLESDLIKSGIILKYVTSSNVLDFNKIRIESEQYRKDLVLSQALISSLQTEIEDITVQCKNLQAEKQDTENCIKEINQLQEKVEELVNEKERAINEKNSLQKVYEQLRSENSGLANKNQNISNKIKEVCKISTDQNEIFNSRLNEYKENFENLHKEFEILLKEKTAFEIENSKMKEEIKINQEKYLQLENELKKGKKKDEVFSSNKLNKVYRITLPDNGNDLTYRKLYEEISLEFEEYKQSQKKVKVLNRLKCSHDQISSDEVIGSQQSEKKNISIDKLQIQIEKLIIDNKSLQSSLANASIQLENEIKQNKSLLLENNKLRFENEKLNKEISFIKDKYERDLLIKSNEIKTLNEEITKVQSRSIENLNSSEKIQEISVQYNQLKDKFEIKEDQLEAMSNKYEMLLQAFQDYGAEIEIKNKKIEDLNTEKHALTGKHEQNLKENSQMQKNEITMKKLLEEAQRKIEEKEKLQEEISTKMKVIETELDEKEKNLTTLNKEKCENEDTYKHRCHVLEDYISEVKSCLYTLHENLCVTIHKFDRYANDDLNSLLTNAFSQNMTKILFQLSSITEESGDQCIVQLTIDFLKIMTSEFENVYDKLFDSNAFVQDSHQKLCEMQHKIKETEAEIASLNEREYKIKSLLKVKEDEKAQMETRLHEQIKELQSENELLKSERDETCEELRQYKTEYYSIVKRNEQLGKENAELVTKVQEQISSYSTLENKILIMSKEKKNLDSIIQNFIKSFPNKEICKLMCDYLAINDQIYKIELEKFSLEGKLNSMDKEYIMLSEDKSSLNTDLSNIVKREQSNMKRLMNDYDKKISEKRESLRKYEQEIFNIEVSMKRTYELSLENEYNYQRVLKELGEIKHGLSETSYHNKRAGEATILSANNGNENHTAKNYINKPEIASLDMNSLFNSATSSPHDKDTMTGYNLGSNINNSNRKSNVLTDYQEIELDYSPEISSEKKQVTDIPMINNIIQLSSKALKNSNIKSSVILNSREKEPSSGSGSTRGRVLNFTNFQRPGMKNNN